MRIGATIGLLLALATMALIGRDRCIGAAAPETIGAKMHKLNEIKLDLEADFGAFAGNVRERFNVLDSLASGQSNNSNNSAREEAKKLWLQLSEIRLVEYAVRRRAVEIARQVLGRHNGALGDNKMIELIDTRVALRALLDCKRIGEKLRPLYETGHGQLEPEAAKLAPAPEQSGSVGKRLRELLETAHARHQKVIGEFNKKLEGNTTDWPVVRNLDEVIDKLAMGRPAGSSETIDEMYQVRCMFATDDYWNKEGGSVIRRLISTYVDPETLELMQFEANK